MWLPLWRVKCFCSEADGSRRRKCSSVGRMKCWQLTFLQTTDTLGFVAVITSNKAAVQVPPLDIFIDTWRHFQRLFVPTITSDLCRGLEPSPYTSVAAKKQVFFVPWPNKSMSMKGKREILNPKQHEATSSLNLSMVLQKRSRLTTAKSVKPLENLRQFPAVFVTTTNWCF